MSTLKAVVIASLLAAFPVAGHGDHASETSATSRGGPQYQSCLREQGQYYRSLREYGPEAWQSVLEDARKELSEDQYNLVMGAAYLVMEKKDDDLLLLAMAICASQPDAPFTVEQRRSLEEFIVKIAKLGQTLYLK